MLALSSPFVASQGQAPLPWAKLVTAGTITPAFSMSSSVAYSQNSDVLFRLPDGNFILFGDTAARISTPAAVLGAATAILSGGPVMSRVIQSKRNGYTFLVISSDGKARYVTAKGDRTITAGSVLYSNILTDLMTSSFGVNSIAAAWDEDAGQLVLSQLQPTAPTLVASLYRLNATMTLVSTNSKTFTAYLSYSSGPSCVQAKAILQANGQILATYVGRDGTGNTALYAAKIIKTATTILISSVLFITGGIYSPDNHLATFLHDDFGTAILFESNDGYSYKPFICDASNNIVLAAQYPFNNFYAAYVSYPNLLRGDPLDAILTLDYQGSGALLAMINGSQFPLLTSAYPTSNHLIDAVPTADGQGFATVDLGGGTMNLSFVGHG